MSYRSTNLFPPVRARAAWLNVTRTSLMTQIAVVVCLFVLSIGFFFRQQILNGFTVLSFDRFDGMLETAMLEHWNNFFHGRSHFNRMDYFYPTKDTLGYNDAFFLYGVIYTIARALGFNPFISSEIVNITILSIGFVSMTLCAVVTVDLGLVVAGFVSSLFVLSSSLFIQLNHAQLLSVALAPLLTTLMYKFFLSLLDGSRKGIITFGVLAAVLHALWLFSTFYMAWYYVYFLFWLSIVALCVMWRQAGYVILTIERSWHLLLTLIGFYAIINIPFGMTFFPKLKETGQHSFDEVLYYTPHLSDVVNVGPDNLVFGKADAAFNAVVHTGFPDYGEWTVGFPPILLVLFLLATVQAGREWRQSKSAPALTALLIALASLASWATAIKVGEHTFWHYVYDYFPGGKATRVVARYQIFLLFPVTLLVGFHMQRWRWKPLTLPLVLLVALLIAEQVVVRNNVYLPVGDEFQRLASFAKPPSSCKSFYVTNSRENVPDPGWIEGIYSHNADAMLLAEYFSLPTLNGYATFTPTGWNLVRPNERERYMSDVKAIVDRYGLTDVCSLDLSSKRWELAMP